MHYLVLKLFLNFEIEKRNFLTSKIITSSFNCLIALRCKKNLRWTNFGGIFFGKKMFGIENRGPIHQHFTRSFYARRSQKHIKTILTWLSLCFWDLLKQMHRVNMLVKSKCWPCTHLTSFFLRKNHFKKYLFFLNLFRLCCIVVDKPAIRILNHEIKFSRPVRMNHFFWIKRKFLSTKNGLA